MPRGKKKTQKLTDVHEAVFETETINLSSADAEKLIVKAKITQPETCNHQNKHYTAGELTCVLPKNHGGDHLGYVNGNPTAWSDAAGTPTRQHA
jgi:hypothetical protein